jgi:hypothetical protein
VSKTHNIVNHLLSYILVNLVRARIHCTGEHQIMPYEQSILVAHVVENIMVELAAAPDSQHVEVSEHSCSYSVLINLRIILSSRHEHIWWDVVTTSHEHSLTVELYSKLGSCIIILLLHFYGSDTVFDGFTENNIKALL